MSSLRSASAPAIAALLLALAGSATATPITTWSYGFSQLQYGLYDNEGFPQVADYDGITPNITSEQLPNGIKLYSPGDGANAFGLTGAQYIPTATQPITGKGPGEVLRGNRFTNYGSATIDGTAWNEPPDLISTKFEFNFDFSAGNLDIYRVQSFFIVFDADGGFVGGVGSSTGFGAYEPGSYTASLQFEDRFNNPIPTAVSIFWGFEVYFDWTGYDDNSTLNFGVPPNSIDIQAVPTPGAAALLTLAGLTTARRRRA